MMNNVAIKFAASTLVIGATMVSCQTSSDANPRLSASRSVKVEQQQASRLHAQAQAALQKGALADALGYAERSVEASPHDASYRLLLGDLYLKNGRFRSAEQAFADVLTLDPGNSRAGFSRALAEIALGDKASALGRLDRLAESSAPGDIGLAYALAGETGRAVELLEAAARGPGANGRVRQNLALAYALSGDWLKARVTAAQDVSPADLDARLQQWAGLANSGSSAQQLASLFGVTAVEDAGQPVRLALAPAQPEPVAYAAAEAPVLVEAPQGEAAPAEVASAGEEPAEAAWAAQQVPPPVQYVDEETSQPATTFFQAEAPVIAAAAEAEAEAEAGEKPVFAAAVESLIKPKPAMLVSEKPAAPIATFARAPRAAYAAPGVARSANGRFVVQIGAFTSVANVEKAWAQAYQRFQIADYTPQSTTIDLEGRTFHRLSISGFASQSDADGVCGTIKAKGGVCFVRGIAGDAPVRWASRYAARG